MNYVEAEKAICINHIPFPLPKGVLVSSISDNNLLQRIDEGLDIASDIWTCSASGGDADDQALLTGSPP